MSLYSRHQTPLSARWAQMTKQEQIIERKKQEIQLKQEAQKQAAALSSAARSSTSASEKKANIFSNDGSFMNQFKKLLEKQQKSQKKDDQPEESKDKDKDKAAEPKEQRDREKEKEHRHNASAEGRRGPRRSTSRDHRRHSDDRGFRDNRSNRWSGDRNRQQKHQDHPSSMPSPPFPHPDENGPAHNAIETEGEDRNIPSLMQYPLKPPQIPGSPQPPTNEPPDVNQWNNDSNENMPFDMPPMGPMGPDFGPPNMTRPMVGPRPPSHMSMGGPPNMGMGGPPIMGMGGPPNMRMVGPPNMGMSGPPNMGMGGPPNMGMGGPPNMGMGGPPNMGMGGPPNMSMGGPPNIGMGGPPNMGMGRPPNMGMGGPPNMGGAGGPPQPMKGPPSFPNMPPNFPGMMGGPNMPPFFGPLPPNMMGPPHPNDPPNSTNGNMPFMGMRPPFRGMPPPPGFGPPPNMFAPPPPSLPVHTIPEPKPMEAVSIPPPEPMKIQNIPAPMPMPLTHIPKPKDLDLCNIPPPSPSSSQVLSAGGCVPAMERVAREVACNGDHWESVLKSIPSQDQSMWFLRNNNSNEYKQYRDLVMKLRAEMAEDRKPEVKPEDKYEPEFSLEDDYSDEEPNAYDNSQDKTEVKQEQEDEYYGREVKREAASSQSDEEDSARRERKRKRKSRWGGEAEAEPSVQIPLPQPPAAPLPPLPATGVEGVKLAPLDGPGIRLTEVNRTNHALLQYAMTNYGSTNLSPEDWKKCEDNFKLNLLYQDMLKKRAEVERLAAAGKHKYDYDSDEDTESGTWEHKLRAREMNATEKWADELTKQATGKHHIGDFLPPEELKKFMEKYSALKGGKEPDLSDYKDFKLKEDNIGFKMLQKLGWNEGQGLGAEGTGIVEPVNKSTQPGGNAGLGVASADTVSLEDDEFDAYRKRMMLAYRFRPNPLNNPRRPYY